MSEANLVPAYVVSAGQQECKDQSCMVSYGQGSQMTSLSVSVVSWLEQVTELMETQRN